MQRIVDPRRRRRRHARPPTSSAASSRREIDAGEVAVTVVDETGQHVYQPGFMYIAMGGERAERPRSARSAPCSTTGSSSSSATSSGSTRPSSAVQLDDGTRLGYDHLVLATGSRIVPEAIEHFDDGGAPLLHAPRRRPSCARALDAFTGGRIVIGIAGMPYKCPPAPLEVAFLIEAELRERGLREQSEIHFCSPIGRAFTIESVSARWPPRSSSRRASSCTRSSTSRPSTPSARSSRASRARSCPTTCSSWCRRTAAQQFLIDSGLAPAPGGWLPTDRHTLQVGGRPNVYALGDATDLPLSKAGSTAHFEAPVVAERIAAAVQGREPDAASTPTTRAG